MTLNINTNLLRLLAGIPTAAIGGAYGYLAAPKQHRIDSMARNAGIGYLAGVGGAAGATLGEMSTNDENYKLPNTIGAGALGGLSGLAVGKMIAGKPEWEKRKEFRSELVNLMHEETEKLRREQEQQRQDFLQRYKFSSDKTQEERPKTISKLLEENPALATIPTAAVIGTALTGDTGSPVKDFLRGALKGALTGGGIAAGASVGNSITNDSAGTVGGGVGGGLLALLAANRLLKNYRGPRKKYAAGPVIKSLIQAKELSDARKYKRKQEILRQLIATHPQDFVIDSELARGNIVGITHVGSGFRIHMLRKGLPQGIDLKRIADKNSVVTPPVEEEPVNVN